MATPPRAPPFDFLLKAEMSTFLCFSMLTDLLDAATLRIGVPQLASYHISEPETISLRIPTGVLYLGHDALLTLHPS